MAQAMITILDWRMWCLSVDQVFIVRDAQGRSASSRFPFHRPTIGQSRIELSYVPRKSHVRGTDDRPDGCTVSANANALASSSIAAAIAVRGAKGTVPPPHE